MDSVLLFVIELLGWIILWAVLYPVITVLAAPIILVMALFQRGTYRGNLTNQYRQLWQWLNRWSPLIP